MLKTEKLSPAEMEVVSQLRSSITQKQSQGISRLRFVKLAAIAFQNGGSKSGDKLANALARGLSAREMAAEEGGNVSAEEAARLAGITKQALLNLYHANKVLGWRTQKQGAVRFPIWQFENGGRLLGLQETLSVLSKGGVLDEWGKIGFFLQTHGLLGGRRPLDLLREGKLQPVLEAAESYVE
jgi:hypothetical protein